MLETEPGGFRGEPEVTLLNRKVCEPPSRVRTALRLATGLPPAGTVSVTFSWGTAGIVDSTSETEATSSGREGGQDSWGYASCDGPLAARRGSSATR